MLVDAKRLSSKSARIIFSVLCLVCTDGIVCARERPLATLLDQSVSVINAQADSSQAGGSRLPTHRPPSSDIPHSVEIASAPTLKHVSYEPQLVHQLAAEIIQAFETNNLTGQQAGPFQAASSYSSVLVSYSSGRSPPPQD
jgi:hypothetical protein